MASKRPYLINACLLLCVLACGALGWRASTMRDAVFIVPGALRVHVVGGASEREITYNMSDPELGWNSLVARRLSLSGWDLPYDSSVWGKTEQYVTTYQRLVSFGPLHLRERAELLGDKRAARIHIVSTWSWQWP